MVHILKMRVSKAPVGGGLRLQAHPSQREGFASHPRGDAEIVLLVPSDSMSDVAIRRKGEGDGEGEDQ